MQIRSLLVTALVGASALAGAVAAAPGASAQPSGQSCGPAHRYVDASSAVVKTHRVVVHGHHARLRCGGPDDSSYVDGKPVTLRVLRTGTVRVWKVPADPSQGMKTVAATELPKWLKRNASEPIYRIHGPAEAVTRLVEQWHP